jgi:exopolysaccharide biosynthesis polyprenyl glycosylphosphotransferase
MIPRRFFWLFDGIAILAAFFSSYYFLPHMGLIFGPSGFLHRIGLAGILEPVVWTGQLPPISELLWMILAVAPITIITLGILGNHRPLLILSRSRILFGGAAPFVGLSVLTTFLFAFKSWHWGRAFAFTFVALTSVYLIAYRLIIRKICLIQERTGRYAENVLLIGLPEAIPLIAKYFSDYVLNRHYRLIGYLRVSNASTENTGKENQPIPELGSIDDLEKLLVARPINEILAIHPITGGESMGRVIECCDHLGIPLRILPEILLHQKPMEMARLYPFDPSHLPGVILRPPQWDADSLFVKRLFDLLIAGVAVVLLSPIMLLIAAAVKLTDPQSSVLYAWPVVGKHGKEFIGYKFRTMIPNADALKKSLESRNEMKGPVFKIKDDPRITTVGKFLRKYSLDELPQLFSVLKGDMSLVGPRPAGINELPRYEFWHKRKLSIMPGITCLWQVSGRNKVVDFDEWVRMDFEYIDHWSLWLDFKILVRTAWAVFGGTGC